MDKAERRKLIREMLIARRAISFVAPLPKTARPNSARKKGGFSLIAFGNGNGAREPQWVKTSDAPAQIVPKIKRARSTSPLTKIAKKAPAKLRREFVSSDDYLAARRRQ